MKRVTAILCAMMLLVLSPAVFAGAETMYRLPAGLKSVPVSVSRVQLPSELPKPVQILSFTVEGGLIRLELDQAVPSVKIKELNYEKAEESTIFSKKDTASAETHRTGKDTSILTVLLSWNVKGFTYTREYNTWSGNLRFVSASMTETADASGVGSWSSAEREFSFRENEALFSETWKLTQEGDTFSRTAQYGTDGQLECCSVTWRSAEDNGYIMRYEENYFNCYSIHI